MHDEASAHYVGMIDQVFFWVWGWGGCGYMYIYVNNLCVCVCARYSKDFPKKHTQQPCNSNQSPAAPLSNTQTTLGHRFIAEVFGEEALPRVGWQIDPFGHSSTQVC